MNDQEIIARFEELEAGRILGDLDDLEFKEWEDLSRDSRCQPDLSLELTAAALEFEFPNEEEVELPASLLKELEGGIADFVVPSSGDAGHNEVTQLSLFRRIFSDNETAWAIAAVLLILFVAEKVVDQESPSSGQPTVVETDGNSPDLAREALRKNADDLIVSAFGGLAGYDGMSGEVVWSDKFQEGYMTLTNLPANDPGSEQYQLWIVDPDRDENPVDGGVFDIPADGATAVIPIRNPLLVNNPETFVITLEQPGGVVVSKQDVVVALAKANQS